MAQIVVGTLRVDLVANTATFTPGLDDATKKAKKAAQDIENEFDNVDLHEAKGSVALLGEMIGIHLPRHVRSFLAELPGISTVMANAFAAVAVIALADALYKAYEHFQKVQEAAKKAKEALADLNITMENQALRLAAANLKIEDQIAALENRPAKNKLAEALIEATLRSGQLNASLTKDLETAKKLIEEQARGSFMSYFHAKEKTSDIADTYKEQIEKIEAIRQENRESEAEFNREHEKILESGTAAQREALAKQFTALKAANFEKLRLQIEGAESGLAIAKKQKEAMDTEVNSVKTTVGNTGLPEDASRVEASRKAIRDAQSERRDLTEKYRILLLDVLNVEQKDVELTKNEVTLAETQKQIIVDMTREAQKHSVIKKELAKQSEDAQKDDEEAARSLGRFNQQYQREVDRSRDAAVRLSHEWDNIALHEREAKDASAEYAIQLALAQGKITEHQAVEQTLVLLTKERGTALQRNAALMAAAAADAKRLSEETMGGLTGTAGQKDAYEKATAEYKYYKEEELRITKEYNAKIHSEEMKATDTFRSELQKWITNAHDVMPKLKAQFFQTMDGISGMLAQTLTTGKADWRAFAAAAVQSILTIAIQAVIAATLMKALKNILGDPDADMKKSADKQKELNFEIAMSDAAKASANTFALTSATMLWPAAFAAAGEAYMTGVGIAMLAKYEKGGIIPNTGVAMVHKGEGVFSAPVTNALLNVARSNMGQAPAQQKRLQMNYSPSFKVWDKADVANALDEHKDVVRGLVRRELARL
jgi:lambda family phage tail tape measure protein